MNKSSFVGAVLLFGVLIFLMMGAERAAAQGPAGAGAPAAARESSHSLRDLNPISWIKKDSNNSTDALGSRSEIEEKLTPRLRAEGVLAANATAADACAPFTALDGCLAALHASHDLGVDFYCLRADVTGVHTSADVSGCKVADGEEARGLKEAIHQMKPDINAKHAAKAAEQQAQDDLKRIGV